MYYTAAPMIAPLEAARALATAPIRRRGALLGVLVLAQRILTAATAWVLFARPFEVKVTVSLALAGVFATRAFLQRSLMSRTEAELMQGATESILDGDVLRRSALPDRDAHADLTHGVYFASHQLSDVLPNLVGDVVAAVFLGLAVVVVEPTRLVVGATALTALAAGGLLWSRGRIHRAVHLAWDQRDRVVQTMVDAVEGRLEIVASGERNGFASEARRRGQDWAEAARRAAASSLVSGKVPLLAIALAVAVALLIESQRQTAFPVTLADVALFASVTPSFAGVAQGLLALIQVEASVYAVARVVAEARPYRSGRTPPTLPATIAFDNVSFRYDGETSYALNEVSFTLEDERIIALSGANGSGKSTCLRLLLALASPQRGAVRIRGMDVTHLDAESWRARIAFLAQRPYLSQRASVRSAIRLLAPGATDRRIQDALDRVGLLPALERMGSQPLDVSVDVLSTGQRQRVALARMLCRDADLFLLDEPDQNLDRGGIALVEDIVRELAKARMVLLAAHTPELLQLAERVVTLETGRVVADERRKR
jgi:ABC-type multidrug transport system fused ATPase/permease subunit